MTTMFHSEYKLEMGSHTCTICGRSFGANGLLHSHMTIVHSNCITDMSNCTNNILNTYNDKVIVHKNDDDNDYNDRHLVQPQLVTFPYHGFCHGLFKFYYSVKNETTNVFTSHPKLSVPFHHFSISVKICI